MEFKTALYETVGELLAENDDMCLAVYWDDNYPTHNCVVMFMELGNFDHVHAAMQALHDKLSRRMGYPVSVCHNGPTDESILIHGCKDDEHVYDAAECCKKQDIESAMTFLKTRKGYRDELQAIALAAECLGDGLGTHAERVLDSLDWNKDVQAQLIKQLVDFHG